MGIKLGVLQATCDGIYRQYENLQEHLLQVLAVYLKNGDPKPTWRAIAVALKSPAVNLAKRNEEQHNLVPAKGIVTTLMTV